MTSAAAPLLPGIASAFPKPGARLDLPTLAGSADALAIAQLAQSAQRSKPARLLAVLAASPLEAQPLLEEIAWFGRP